MQILKNPWRGKGLVIEGIPDEPISTAVDSVKQLLQYCPVATETPLLQNASLTSACEVNTLWLKDERPRMGLGSFKATGAAYVIAGDAQQVLMGQNADWATFPKEQYQQLLQGKTYVCSSAGNHGLSIAAGARIFGAKAVIYLSQAVPESFADRLRAIGTEVVRAGDNYEASLDAARAYADEHNAILLSDSSWAGYMDIPRKVMEGYTIIADETVQQLANQQPPTHIMLQAGVGGIAAAATAMFRQHWGEEPQIVIVEPDAAPALHDSIKAGKAVTSSGPVSSMGRLDCKEPSFLTLAGLSKQADWFVTLSDEMVEATVAKVDTMGISSTPSGLAGLAVLQPSMTDSAAAQALREELDIKADSRVLVFVTEQAEVV